MPEKQTIICSLCSQEKELSMFQRRRGSKTGYRSECKACIKLKKRKYYLDNHSEFLSKRKSYYEKNKDEILELCRADYNINPEKYSEKNKKSYIKNSERVKTNSRKYAASLKGRITTWKNNAKYRGIEWNLPEGYFENISMLCFYTGKEMTFETNKFNTISLDRKDSSKGYSEDNVVFCCQAINRMKFDLTFDEFIECCKVVGQRF